MKTRYIAFYLVVILFVVFGGEVSVDSFTYTANTSSLSASGVGFKTTGVANLLKAD